MPTNSDRQRLPINVCLLQAPGQVHALALLEAAEYVAEKCRLAGHPATLTKNRVLPLGMNIVFGAHIDPRQSLAFPPNTVIFNTEQIPESSVWIKSDYKACLDRFFVWDYSDTNLAAIGHDRKCRVDFLHVERLRRITRSAAPEFDLLFYGTINERRNNILSRLRQKGINVQAVFGHYSAERDALLGKARAVLNLHFYESQIFQQIRAFYPLSNGIPVISENFPRSSAPALYGEVVYTPGTLPFESFVASLLSDESRFEADSRKRIERFRATAADGEFAGVLSQTLGAVTGGQAASAPAPPSRINLGSGKDYRFGYLNVDILPSLNPDLLIDLSSPLQIPLTLESPVYGVVALSENSLDEILAIDVLEHVPQLTQLMENCLRLLKEGGKFNIVVPYDLSLGAWQDPTHVRAFNENSWLYFTQWFWYLGWFAYRFDLAETVLNLSELGKTMMRNKIPQAEVLRTPRAVDSMQVVLTKRRTTAEERTEARAFSGSLILPQ